MDVSGNVECVHHILAPSLERDDRDRNYSVQYSTVKYSTVRYSMIQCSTLLDEKIKQA